MKKNKDSVSKMTLSFMVAFAAVFAASAETLYWTGTASRWGDAGAWTNSAGEAQALASGDSVVINIGETPTTVNNDIANLSLAKFTALGKNDIVLTLDGKPIGIAGVAEPGVKEKNRGNVIVWTNSCSLLLNADISFSGGNGTIYFGGYSTVTYGDIDVASGCALKIRGRPQTIAKGIELGITDLVNDKAIVEFYGDIGGDGADLYLSLGENGAGTYDYYYGNVNCSRLWIGYDSKSGVPYFKKSGNRVGALVFAMTGAFYLQTADAFTEDTVIDISDSTGWMETRAGRSHPSGVRFKSGSHQILNRLAGGNPATSSNLRGQYIFANTSSKPESPTTDTCTLDLKGTEDAVAYVCLCDAVSVIWDPTGNYTQDFRNRIHPTSGSIWVKGGTVRTSGTNSFQNLSSVLVGSGATLEIASTNNVAFPACARMILEENACLRVADADSTAFTAGGTSLTLASGAKIEMAAGATMNVGRLFYDGQEVAAGTYTSAPWKDGADGAVVVAGEMGANPGTDYIWGGATGDWNVPANWLYGALPGVDDTALLDAFGQSFTASFDGESDTLPKKLRISGENNFLATLALANEVNIASTTVTVSPGGRISVPSGATLVNTNGTMSVQEGGEVVLSGSGRLNTGGWSNHYVANNGGGKLLFTDNAVLRADYHNSAKLLFGKGDTIFTGSSKLSFQKKSFSYYVTPNSKGKEGVARLVFSDSAKIEIDSNGGNDTFRVGYSSDSIYGTGIVEFVSSASYAPAANVYVGGPTGHGTAIFGAGKVTFSGRGFWVACAGAGRYGNSDRSGGVGHLVVTGGVLNLSGASGVCEGTLRGLRVGDGAGFGSVSGDPNDYIPWQGYYLQTGGATTNKNMTCVGGQRAIGSFRQTGGIFRQTGSTFPFMTGIRGGKGEVHFDGGEATIAGDVYVGGVFTNAIPHSVDNGVFTEWPLTRYGWGVDVHYGTGLFSVSNGTVELKKNLNLGYDGTGIVERVGSQGSFAVNGNMVLSNTTAIASASILRFVLDADGIKPIQVGGAVTSTPGSRIEVDISSYAGKKGRHALLTAASIDGSFDDVEITSAEDGPNVSGANVQIGANEIYLTLPTGMAILFR
jgi:hypothetical protein